MYRVPEMQARQKNVFFRERPANARPRTHWEPLAIKSQKTRNVNGNLVEKSTAYIVRQSRGADGKAIAGRHMSAQP